MHLVLFRSLTGYLISSLCAGRQEKSLRNSIILYWECLEGSLSVAMISMIWIYFIHTRPKGFTIIQTFGNLRLPSSVDSHYQWLHLLTFTDIFLRPTALSITLVWHFCLLSPHSALPFCIFLFPFCILDKELRVFFDPAAYSVPEGENEVLFLRADKTFEVPFTIDVTLMDVTAVGKCLVPFVQCAHN